MDGHGAQCRGYVVRILTGFIKPTSHPSNYSPCRPVRAHSGLRSTRACCCQPWQKPWGFDLGGVMASFSKADQASYKEFGP